MERLRHMFILQFGRIDVFCVATDAINENAEVRRKPNPRLGSKEARSILHRSRPPIGTFWPSSQWWRRMMDKSTFPAETRAWIATSNIARYQKELDSETDLFRSNVLLALLEMEFSKFENEKLP
jgi:hypothetical protein